MDISHCASSEATREAWLRVIPLTLRVSDLLGLLGSEPVLLGLLGSEPGLLVLVGFTTVAFTVSIGLNHGQPLRAVD
jgi:hypothetical protein